MMRLKCTSEAAEAAANRRSVLNLCPQIRFPPSVDLTAHISLRHFAAYTALNAKNVNCVTVLSAHRRCQHRRSSYIILYRFQNQTKVCTYFGLLHLKVLFLHIQLWIYAYNYVFNLIIMFSRASNISNYACYAAAHFSGIFRHRTIKLTCRNTCFLSNIFFCMKNIYSYFHFSSWQVTH